MILPFLELKEDEIDAECYRCETIVSSDDISDAYHCHLKEISFFKLKVEFRSILNTENISDFDESEMSEISVEDEVDCSIFVNEQTETKKNLISENSVAFARIVENKGSQVLNEQATVFPKIQTVPNQVFAKQGLNSKDVTELKVLVDNDNSDGCDAFFWIEPIDNSDETKGLSEMTSWKSRGKYISGSVNRKNTFSQPGTSGTKPFQNSNSKIPKPTPTKNFTHVSRIHKSPEELIAKRKQMNARYKKNLKERKQFWRNKNTFNSTSNLNQKVGTKSIRKPQPNSPTKLTFQKPPIFAKKATGSTWSDNTNKIPLCLIPKSNDLKGKAKLYPEPLSKPIFRENSPPHIQKNITLRSKHSLHSVKSSKGLHNHLPPNPRSDTFVIRDKQYDPEWYIDSGCSRHMTGRREELREYRSLRNGGRIRYGNNATGEIKGYGMITNGELSIRKVAYVEGLRHNLINVSQLVVGTGLKVTFDEEGSELIEKNSEKIVLRSKRMGEMFPLDMKAIIGKPAICLLTRAANDDSWLWHSRLSHMNFRDINKLVLGDLVRGLPLLKYDKDRSCDACELRKQSRKSHSTIINTKIIEPLKLLHIDLCGPSAIESVAHNKYILVVMDDFSRFTWVLFLKQKSEAATNMINFIKQIEVLLRKQVRMIRSDNGTEFKNQLLDDFLISKGISYNFSAPYTPQQNGVAERRNRSLCEAARTMLSFAKLPLYFWADAIATTCFTQNRSTINKRFLCTPYEILNKRKPNVKFFHVFGSKCFIFNSKEKRVKWDEKADEGIFLGYSLSSKAYRVLNKRSRKIEETYYVTFDDKYNSRGQHPEKQLKEIFPESNQVTIPLMNLYEVFMNLFDEPETAKSAEKHATDNQGMSF
ncbi:hypothetical protein L1887_14902 [Cichorium endivia]|nr:hypothetical protein L1887_14902 [Cichorium endivia]